MKTWTLIFGCAIILLTVHDGALAKEKRQKNSTTSSKLFLTDYIKSGKLEEAKEEALIKWNVDGVSSFSGFFTVNETTNSNLFFWFVPAMVEDPEDAPIILWLNGGPGTSSLFGLFVENGPFKVKKRGRIPKLVVRIRKDTWARKHNILYIDSPVGTGFSYTENEQGYAKSQDDIARDLYTALQQFFKVFPDFTNQDVYLGGESYAAKSIPRLGLKIHQENENGNNSKIHFKGIISGGPLTDPQSLTNSYSDYYYNLGIIDEEAQKFMKTEEGRIATLISEGKYTEAQTVRDSLLFKDETPSEFLFNSTGFQAFASALRTKPHKKRHYFTRFLNQSSIRKLIHVGEQPFNNVSTIVAEYLRNDTEFSTKSDLEQLINLKYRVLIYVGQLDLITPHTGVYNFIRSMNYEGKEDFESAKRYAMLDMKRGDIAGYVKASRNLYYVVVRNAGHFVPADEPRWCREMIEKFVAGTKDSDF